MARDNVLMFPRRAIVRTAPPPASPIRIGFWRGKALLGELLNKLGFAGRIRNLKIQDALLGQDIVIRVSPAYTRVTVNGKHYDYYHRIWGNTSEARRKVHFLPKRGLRAP